MDTDNLLRIIAELKKKNEELVYQLELMNDKLEYVRGLPSSVTDY